MSVKKQKTKAVAKKIVRQVLEDTGQAYEMSCETHVNADYADYASSQALESFKQALDDPNLSHDALCAILRKASNRASSRQCKTPWSMFMANYISKHGNNNARHVVMKSANEHRKLH